MDEVYDRLLADVQAAAVGGLLTTEPSEALQQWTTWHRLTRVDLAGFVEASELWSILSGARTQ